MTCTVIKYPRRSSDANAIQYPQAVGELVLESTSILKLNAGAVYYIRHGYSSTQETNIKTGSTVEISV